MKIEPTETKLYTTDEFANLIGFHPESVRKIIRQGRIKAKRFGRSYRILGSEVDRILKDGIPTME